MRVTAENESLGRSTVVCNSICHQMCYGGVRRREKVIHVIAFPSNDFQDDNTKTPDVTHFVVDVAPVHLWSTIELCPCNGQSRKRNE